MSKNDKPYIHPPHWDSGAKEQGIVEGQRQILDYLTDCASHEAAKEVLDFLANKGMVVDQVLATLHYASGIYIHQVVDHERDGCDKIKALNDFGHRLMHYLFELDEEEAAEKKP